MRIGIFGGSFDPIHTAHLILAETAREQLALEQVRFIPAKISPFKQEHLPAEDKHRVEMIKLAINGNPHFVLDTRELERGGVSYTVDTLATLQAEIPESEFWLLMGADSLQDFPKWKSPAQLLRMCRLGVMVRPNKSGEIPLLNWQALDDLIPVSERGFELGKEITAPILQISSTELRYRIGQKRSIRYQIPAAVEAYIHSHRLYEPSKK